MDRKYRGTSGYWTSSCMSEGLEVETSLWLEQHEMFSVAGILHAEDESAEQRDFRSYF